jgi:hypothetical protein
LVEAGKPPLVLRQDLRFKAPVPIARRRHFHGAKVPLHLFPALPVAVVAAAAPRSFTFLVAQVMRHLSPHGPFQQRFSQLLQQPFWPNNLFFALPRKQLI